MELVPRIASNIDAMLARHDIVGGVEQLSLVGGGDGQSVDKVNRVRQGRGRGRGGSSVRGKSFSNFTRKKPFCPECHLLGRKLNLSVNYDHLPAECPRPGTAVNMVLAEEEELVPNEDDDYTGKDTDICPSFVSNNSKQMKCDPEPSSSEPEPEHEDINPDHSQMSIFNKISIYLFTCQSKTM